MKEHKHTDPYEQCVACQLERSVEQVEALGSRLKGAARGDRSVREEAEEFYGRLRADIGRSHIPVVTIDPDVAFAGVDRSATPEKLSGAKLGEPAFDYAKAMREGHEAMRRQVASPPPPFRVGDTVRWWPDLHDDDNAVAFTTDRSVDGVIVKTDGRYVRQLYVTAINNWHGTRELLNWPCKGTLYDTTVSPGVIRAVPPDTEGFMRRAMQERAARAAVHAASIDPLDVEYDDVKLRELLCRDQIMRQSDSRGCDSTPWPSLTTAQRTAVSAHWSAELRAKVKAGAAADKARAPSVMVDHED